MEATVLDRVTPEMQLYGEESFGPVVCVVRVRGVEEAVRVANDTEYGLSSSVFGRDLLRRAGVARRIEAGMCHVNGPTVHDEAQMPFGGMKASGNGRFGGRAALDEFTELRTHQRGHRPARLPVLADHVRLPSARPTCAMMPARGRRMRARNGKAATAGAGDEVPHAEQVEAFAGDPDFMASLARGLAVIRGLRGRAARTAPPSPSSACAPASPARRSAAASTRWPSSATWPRRGGATRCAPRSSPWGRPTPARPP